MKRIIDTTLWGTLILLLGPSMMIVASWNALPGDALYGTKIALERTALAIARPSYTTGTVLQMKLTERRYAEAKQLLASKQSIQGLPYFQQQLAETKKAIEKAPDKQTQVALATQYINTLSTVANELEAQKQTITTAAPRQSSQPPQLPQAPQSPPNNFPNADSGGCFDAPDGEPNLALALADQHTNAGSGSTGHTLTLSRQYPNPHSDRLGNHDRSYPGHARRCRPPNRPNPEARHPNHRGAPIACGREGGKEGEG